MPAAMRMWAVLALVATFLAVPPARAAAACAAAGEPACVLQAIWDAAAVLPAEKQERLKPVFLDTVALSGDDALLSEWQHRLGGAPAPPPDYPDYAGEQAKAVLAEAGWDGFLQRARAGAPPFNTGRPEIMAAGARLAPDAATRNRIVSAMFELAGPASGPAPGGLLQQDFERGDFGHALAELSMEACDLASFDRAAALTAEPDGLRYAFWRARITGGASSLTGRVRHEGAGDDTRFVRAAIEGYGAILQRGYCTQ